MSDDQQLDPQSPNNPLRDALGLPNVIFQWRKALGWSQDELERQSGVSQRTISGIESGKIGNPQDGTLRQLAEAFAAALDMNAEALLTNLKNARAHRPGVTVSEFAQEIDNLLKPLDPPFRAFVEQMLIRHYYAILEANRFSAEVRKAQKARRKPRTLTDDDGTGV